MRFSKGLATVVLLAALVLTGLVGCGPGDRGSVESDRAALVAFYHATGGPQWNNNENWLSDEPLGEWFGIATNDAGRVTELNLLPLNMLMAGNNLTGFIPPELGNLSNLERLDLAFNQLSGPIPPDLGNLSSLEDLNLSWNQLTGPIPPELGNLSNLENLNISYNQLSGAIPPKLGNLSNLEIMTLYNNKLTGELPLSLAMLTDLNWLTYQDNAGLCMPRSMQSWRKGISIVEGPDCPPR